MSLPEIDLDAFAKAIEEKTYRWLKEHSVMRFGVGHPADFIMPVFKYCIYAVTEEMRDERTSSVDVFKTRLKYCISDVIAKISMVLDRIERHIIPEAVEELKKLKKEAVVVAKT